MLFFTRQNVIEPFETIPIFKIPQSHHRHESQQQSSTRTVWQHNLKLVLYLSKNSSQRMAVFALVPQSRLSVPEQSPLLMGYVQKGEIIKIFITWLHLNKMETTTWRYPRHRKLRRLPDEKWYEESGIDLRVNCLVYLLEWDGVCIFPVVVIHTQTSVNVLGE